MPAWRKRLGLYLRAQETLAHGLGVRGAKPRGFYVPYRYAQGVTRPPEDDTVNWLRAAMDAQQPRFLDHLRFAAGLNEQLARLQHEARGTPGAPRLDSTWFPGLDAALAYAMVARYRPARIIEVGSGHSTRLLARGLRDASLAGELFSIDPEPRRAIDRLCTEVWRQTVTSVPVERFRQLAANDILFIDSSHLALPGTDVDYLFTRVLPTLASGVLVHVHDIFLPHAYPNRWPWNHYSEQALLLAALSGGERYEILCPNAYLRRYCTTAAQAVDVPLNVGAPESSFWICVR